MKKIVLFLVLICAVPAFTFAAEGVQWLSLKAGIEKAKAEKKPVIVDFFYGKGCPRCEQLDKDVYHNPLIAKEITDDFVPIRIDLTKKLSAEEEALGNKYEFKHDCLLLFLNAELDLIKGSAGKRLCFVDKVDPEEFVSYLDTVKKQYGK